MIVEHYNTCYTRALTNAEIKNREITITMDPYRIADIYRVGGGAREQILKKALRWTTKGDSERRVLNEIAQAVARRLEMLEEDRHPILLQVRY